MLTGRIVRILVCAIAVTVCSGCAGTPAPASSPAASLDTGTPGRYIEDVFDEIEISKDIEYGSAKNEKGETEKLFLDLYQPKGDTAQSRPAVIFVHGGGFTGGDKAGGIERMLAERLARKGYVTLSINYRLRTNPGADWVGTFRDSTDDAYSAFAWLVDHKDAYRIDASHIAFGGHSAGSNIVVELCYSDWTGRKYKKDGVFTAIAMSGPQTVFADPRADDPFCIIIHGMRDELVSYSLSEGLADRFKTAGTPYLLHPLPICVHNLEPAFNEVCDTITSELYRELTGKESGIAIRSYEGK